METRRNSSLCLGVCLVLLGLALPAAAQTMPKAEVSGGYQLLNLSSGGDSESFPKGWYVDVAGNLNRHIGVVVEVGGNYKSMTESVTVGGVSATATADIKLHEFMGGVRVSSRTNPTVVPFAQVLAGGMNGSVSVAGSSSIGGTTLFSASSAESETNFALQVGGGANIRLTDKVGVRVGADYLRIFVEGEGTNVFRFGVGINVPF